jgi:hypothetical protein
MKIFNKIGNEALLNREKSLFLCSKHAPYSVYDKVFGWVDSLTADDCVICFNSSELENEVMRALLVNQVPTILVVMNRFTDRYNVQIEKALTEERMLILVLQRDEPYGAGQTPRLRNQYMLQKAEHIVCGYVNKNGSIFPLLAGMKNVRYLEQEYVMMAAEPSDPPTHQRWTVWQDKILLRMFYEDMGLHAIKKQLRRTYISVRNRIKAITLPEEVLKGGEFEDFVLELFDLNETKSYSLLEWRGDKSLGEISPASNTYPDFVLEYNGGKWKKKIAVECKWRANIPRRLSQPLFMSEQIARYQEYAQEKAIDVSIILGVGGEPSMPEELYLIPINSVSQIQSKPSMLKQFKRKIVNKWLSIDEFKEKNVP